MRIWFDTEFMEDGRTIDLLSIGAVSEDDRVYYAEVSDVDHRKANPWVREHVLPLLTGEHQRTRAQIAVELVEFAGDKPEWWAYYADYDWVVLCQLYGRMVDLPKGWPMYCRDLKQTADAAGNPDLKVVERLGGVGEHNALSDAVWCRDAWRYVMEGRYA